MAQTRKDIAARWYRKRAKDPAFLVKHAARMRKRRALLSARQRDVIREKRLASKPLLLMQAARLRAKKTGLPFDLDRAWVEKNWTGMCALTGMPFEMRLSTLHPFSPSIDRKNNAEGYVKGNCRFVLFGVNSLKGTGTDIDVRDIAQALVARAGLH